MKVVVFCAISLLIALTQALPLPSAFLPPSPKGPYYGNATRDAATISEINSLKQILLKDPLPSLWNRTVLKVSSYGAIANDGKDDWDGIHNAIYSACTKSQALLNTYQQQHPSTPLPSGLDDRPVLVELQWDANGVYDIAHGIWLPPVCRYVLFNGQNCTILTHFEPGFVSRPVPDPSNYIWWDTVALFPCFDNNCFAQPKGKYVLSFNLAPAIPASTVGIVQNLVKNSTGSVIAFDIRAIALHPAFSWSGFIQYNHLDPYGGFAHTEDPHAVYGGYKGNVSVTGGTTEGQIGGLMRITIGENDVPYVGGNVKVGQWFGVQRGWMVNLGWGLQSIQGINTMYLGTEMGVTNDGDIIDCHSDRLVHAMYMVGGGPVGQMSVTGRIRWWHSSFDGGSDDDIDPLAPEGDVINVDYSSNTLQLRVTGGRWAPTTMHCPPVNSLVEIGHYPDFYNPYATLTIQSCVSNDTEKTTYMTFTTALPKVVQIGDLVVAIGMNPTTLHIKNIRGGNHIYNLLNVKAQTLIVEQSFMYNTTMACVDVSSDAGYWYEGARVATLVVADNVFDRCFSSIQFAPYGLHGQAPSAAHSVNISNNYFFANSTTAQGDWFPHVTVDLSSIQNFVISKNQFNLVKGMRNNLPLIQLCNTHDGVISGNQVYEQPLSQEMGGSSCTYDRSGVQVCPNFPLNVAVQYATKDGCLPKYTYAITFSGNSFPAIQPHANIFSVIASIAQKTYDPTKPFVTQLPTSPGALVSSVSDGTGYTVSDGVFYFNGNQYIDLKYPINGLSMPTADFLWGGHDLTIQLFVLTSNDTRNMVWFSSCDGWTDCFFINQVNSQVEIHAVHNGWAQQTVLTAPIQPNQWTYFALVISNVATVGDYDQLTPTATYQLYINAQLVATKTSQAPPPLISRPYGYLAYAFSGYSPDKFKGYIKSVEIAPSALAASSLKHR